jgi:hypothetical protein
MYIPFYETKEWLFRPTPGLRFLHLEERQRDAPALLVHRVLLANGIVGRTGVVRTGKATLLRSALSSGLRSTTPAAFP